MADFLKHLASTLTEGKMISAIAAVAVVAIVVRLLQRALAPKVHDPANRPSVRTFIAWFGLVVAIFIITSIFGEKLGRFSMAISVLGAGVAFALQEVIVSFAGWLAILFAGFYRTGDRVQLGGIQGDVIEIGILRTTVLEIGEWIKGDLYTGRIVRVANSFIFKEPVFNYTGAFPYIWDELTVPIRYDSDSKLARQIVERVIDETTKEAADAARRAWEQLGQHYKLETDPRIDPMVTMTATDNWVQFTVRYPVNYRMRRITKDRFFTRLLEELERTQGRVGIASSTFQVVAPSVLDVNIRTPDGTKQ